MCKSHFYILVEKWVRRGMNHFHTRKILVGALIDRIVAVSTLAKSPPIVEPQRQD